MPSRREFLEKSALVAAFAGLITKSASADDDPPPPSPQSEEEGISRATYRPVVTPDGATLPFRMVAGVKVFHLIAEPVEHEFAPGLPEIFSSRPSPHFSFSDSQFFSFYHHKS